MSLPIEFLSGADAELQGAFNQFEDYREGFGVEFLTAVEAYLSRIALFPEIAPFYFQKGRRSHAFAFRCPESLLMVGGS